MGGSFQCDNPNMTGLAAKGWLLFTQCAMSSPILWPLQGLYDGLVYGHLLTGFMAQIGTMKKIQGFPPT